MAETVDDIQSKADPLLDALAVYDRFVRGWPYGRGTVPSEVERYLSELEEEIPETETGLGVVLATEIRDLYQAARNAEATYVEQARNGGRSDWDRIVAETEPVRTACRKVHVAGYGTDPETGEPGYVVPPEMCPANLVSMNAGSSPVTFEERVLQYEAFARAFDVSPDVVYHPGSGHDVSPSVAFPESRVVYVDVDEAAMTDLNRTGYEAVGADAAAYELDERADVIVFRNAGMLEEAIVGANLQAGGWVLANDHLESATHLRSMDSLELVGVVPDTWNGDVPTVDRRELNAYLSPIETEAEYRRWRPDEYRQIENRSSRSIADMTRPYEANRTAENPGSGLPYKKGSPLDLYVFAKRS